LFIGPWVAQGVEGELLAPVFHAAGHIVLHGIYELVFTEQSLHTIIDKLFAAASWRPFAAFASGVALAAAASTAVPRNRLDLRVGGAFCIIVRPLLRLTYNAARFICSPAV
jgi:hypothetical protein